MWFLTSGVSFVGRAISALPDGAAPSRFGGAGGLPDPGLEDAKPTRGTTVALIMTDAPRWPVMIRRA